MSIATNQYLESGSVKCLIMGLMLLSFTHVHAQHKLTRLWESEPTLAVPESVLVVPDGLYVSLVDGQALEKDGKGGIAKLDRNGKIINASWVTGLNAPKGMGIWKGRLYVTNISEVVVIDTATGKIESRIQVEGAKGLNDIAVDDKGSIYVSDSELGKIIQIYNGKPSLYFSGLCGVNGLCATGRNLYVLTDEHVYRINPQRKIIALANIPKKGGDGIVALGKGNFLFTIYSGLAYYLGKSGNEELLLDTEADGINCADIGYDPANQIVFVPTLFKKSVVAYRFEQ
ncbi:SMP-30/gluconolactonase/LRE family protein [Flavobacterium psychrotrophum]|uniref:SMP-30/gluconolactonase/LRE family protein n=1 Tax=Flavobacterium psychrotrophum TaxID=2294119 RepID=UPI000E321D8F|nr:ATP/GTP-binding protein [Flavobacterium psychrotrophum]